LTFQKKYRRGYPVALLIGFKEEGAVVWKVFSHVVKPEKTIQLEGTRNESKAVYNFHESLVNAMRPAMKEGVKSVVLASAPRTDYSAGFLRHVREHHSWLVQGTTRAAFADLTGTATSVHEVTILTRSAEFRKIVGETNLEETENLLELLERRLNTTGIEPLVLYSLEEAENALYNPWVVGKPKPEYIVLSDTYNAKSRQKNRLQRLQQIATNKGVKIRIVDAESPAGKRVLQLGGIVCILKP
jgi:stalled ribosome rescue protein Dom34